MDRRLTMKYTKEQRLDIGRRIYDGEITKYDATQQYDISHQTARDYMRLYRNETICHLNMGVHQKVEHPFKNLFLNRITLKHMKRCQKTN